MSVRKYSLARVRKSSRCGRSAGGGVAGVLRPRGAAIARPTALACSGARKPAGSWADGDSSESKCTARLNINGMIRVNARVASVRSSRASAWSATSSSAAAASRRKVGMRPASSSAAAAAFSHSALVVEGAIRRVAATRTAPASAGSFMASSRSAIRSAHCRRRVSLSPGALSTACQARRPRGSRSTRRPEPRWATFSLSRSARSRMASTATVGDGPRRTSRRTACPEGRCARRASAASAGARPTTASAVR
jgi:hypothetical protein